MELRDLYLLWCKEKGYKPSYGKAMQRFFSLISQ